MAHIISLPLEFKFETRKCSYQPVLARVSGIQFGRPFWVVQYEVVKPEKLSGSYRINSSPEVGEAIYAAAGAELEAAGVNLWDPPLKGFTKRQQQQSSRILKDRLQEKTLEVLYCHASDKNATKRIDPWAMRDEFLELDQETEALASFLTRWGAWSRDAYPDRPPFSHSETESLIFSSRVWQERDELVAAMKRGAESFLSSYGDRLGSFEVRPEFPHFYHESEFCHDALLTSVAVDYLRGVKFKECLRPDCQKPFRPESRHERQYCCQHCAHLESVRRGRKKKIQSQNKRGNHVHL